MHKPSRWILTACVLIALLATGCGSSRPANATATTTAPRTLTGTFTLRGTEDTAQVDEDGIPSGGDFIDLGTLGCAGTNGYDDIEAGLQVQVSNETDATIGTGELGIGTMTSTECSFPFAVQDLPAAKFYKITVGHRGELDYSAADLQAVGWTVAFTLG